jgi:hypothetical protein
MNDDLNELARELLQTCKEQHEAIDMLFAMLINATADRQPHCFFPSESGQPWEAVTRSSKVIARASEVLE